MNTRVFKDISKVQHRAWLGFTTRQVIFLPFVKSIKVFD
ncbi:TPA: PrgI family protein, partial [Streptococcus suis]|nr:PrgI family protein [Streptococcus suis]